MCVSSCHECSSGPCKEKPYEFIDNIQLCTYILKINIRGIFLQERLKENQGNALKRSPTFIFCVLVVVDDDDDDDNNYYYYYYCLHTGYRLGTRSLTPI